MSLDCLLNGHAADNLLEGIVCVIVGFLGGAFGLIVAAVTLLIVFSPCLITLLVTFGAGVGIGRRRKGP